MGRDKKRRQKALMKKRQKDKLRKKKAKKEGFLSSTWTHLSPKSIIYNARNYPIYECLIGSSWKKRGMANILLSRQQPDGNLIFGVYLVDIFCLGLKNTFCHANFSMSEYEEDLKVKIYREQIPVECPVDLAHQIIYGAIDYASELGFKPQKDFKLSRYILEERDKFGEITEVEFGKDGKPFYIAGPDDDVEQIMRKLEAKLDPDDFKYFFPIDEIPEELMGED